MQYNSFLVSLLNVICDPGPQKQHFFFFKLRCILHLKAEEVSITLMYGLLG